MGWTINNKTPEELGVTVAGWSETPLTIDELQLTVVTDDYTGDVPAELAHDGTVSLKLNGVQMFQGRVIKTPRMMNAKTEQLAYVIAGPFWYLDNLTMAETKTYLKEVTPADFATGTPPTPVFEDKAFSTVFLGRLGETTGVRISQVLAYAVSQGVPIAIGAIAAGIDWFVVEHKDQTCGQVIRDYMRLMVDCVAWIDYSAETPTFNVTAQAGLTPLTLDVNAGNLIVDHEIDRLDIEVPRGVVVSYERLDNFDGLVLPPKLYEDVAGESTGWSVLRTSVPLRGSNTQTEKAVVQVAEIPEDGATDDDAIKWWVDRSPELSAIAEVVGLDNLAAILNLPSVDVPADDVRAHKRSLPKLKTLPTPVNPAAVSVVQTDNVNDYPNELVSGSIPDWIKGVRVRPMVATVTIGVKQSDIDNIIDVGKKKSMTDIFTQSKTFGGVAFLCEEWSAEFFATNASNEEYSRVTAYEPPEDPPTGIAADVYAQYTRVRHGGSLTIKEEEISKDLRMGKGVDFTGGRAEWATMKEIVQSVSYDVVDGTSSATFGPPPTLGVDDMIDRLKNHKSVPFTYEFDPDDKKQAMIGGTLATAYRNTERKSVGGDVTCELGGIVGGKITPGYVIGGGASQLIDIGAVTPTANTTHYVICPWTADIEDGAVGPGGTMGAVTFSSGASVPDDVVPHAADAAGIAYAPVVGWDVNLNRVGAGCGAITIGFCPGGFIKGRM